MCRQLLAVLVAATVVAALVLSGCAHKHPATAPASTSATPAASSPRPVPTRPPAPPPQALTDVLYRLADPSVPGSAKLNLIEGATPEDAGALDKFASALLANGFAPPTFQASDVAWSDRDPAEATATINVSAAGVSGFSFPMDFKSYQGGWQLAQQSAAALLEFGSPHPSPAPAPPP